MAVVSESRLYQADRVSLCMQQFWCFVANSEASKYGINDTEYLGRLKSQASEVRENHYFSATLDDVFSNHNDIMEAYRRA